MVLLTKSVSKFKAKAIYEIGPCFGFNRICSPDDSVASGCSTSVTLYQPMPWLASIPGGTVIKLFFHDTLYSEFRMFITNMFYRCSTQAGTNITRKYWTCSKRENSVLFCINVSDARRKVLQHWLIVCLCFQNFFSYQGRSGHIA